MLVSMTGFGQGEASDGASTVSVEIRTVNHRFLDYSLKLPRVLNARERDIKERVRTRIARGRVYLTVVIETAATARQVKVNQEVMEQYLRQLREFAAAQGLSGDVDIRTLAQLPDVFEAGETEEEIDRLWPLVEKGLGDALEECHRMRATEGRTLEDDLNARIAAVEKTVTEIDKVAPTVSAKHAEAFRKRIDKLVANTGVDSERLTTEIALMADRLDVTEEITRLKSHIEQFKDAIARGGEVSKKLTYILQEIHREASTIGAKASDSDMTQHVVTLKEETEKLREQVQNIE